MDTESFRERNRLRRLQNAFRNLHAYAESAQIPDAETEAERAAQQIHAPEVAVERAARQAALGRALTERAIAQGDRGEVASAKQGIAGASAAPVKAIRQPRVEKGAAAKTASVKQPQSPAGAAGKEGTASAKGEGDTASVPHRLEDRTKEQLYGRAQELDIEGRSGMTKEELIDAIRNKT